MGTKSVFYDEGKETLSQDELHRLQSERLAAVFRHVYDKNTTQRERYRNAGIAPEDIRGLDDLRRIPTMDKTDLRNTYPLGLSCVPKREILEMHMSSGATGTPVVMPYTQHDLDLWAECMARCLRMAGAQDADVIQITPSFGLFNGGFGFYRGAEALGLFVLPTGSGNTQRQIRLARDFGSRIITGVVSYGIRLMEVLDELGETLPDLEIGIFGGEVFSDSMKDKLAEGLGVEVFDIYGITETGGVGMGMECPAHDGLHIWEDHHLIEIVDPATGEPVPDGSLGELIVTALTREALPAVRYRTGDLTRIVSRDRCACGRTHVRIAPITGRTDDMLNFRGVTFSPWQVEQALMEIPGVGANYRIVVDDTEGYSHVKVVVEADSKVTEAFVERHLRNAIGVLLDVDVLPLGELPRDEGKVRRVLHRDAEGRLH
ncbi:MAG TPA: phenylacetate--CoA ligase [Candidatus Hydrogenedentes bacterium]|nr:phenylacetate--CoA ligase [Candidatus Hydrogenedentota bacterium]HRT19706.1 phenylacetate--CoA ligase [Candidatus Hydrogenedentota bacterium]HRT64480.1 phenylacetate--CoA ligase [Candidatus Hydrogenedentota bacterium]